MNAGKIGSSFIFFISIFLIISESAISADLSFLTQFRKEFIQLAKEAEKCAVSISATIHPAEKSTAGPYIQMVNSAAGLVYDDHHVIVKHKVVMGSDDIEIKFYNGQKQKGKVIGVDPDYGLALLQVGNTIDSIMLPHPMSSAQSVAPGEPVLIISNSLDIMPAASFGIVNCTRNDGMIQVSADMPAGSSGGAVFDFQARLVGLVAAEIDLFADELPYSSDIVSSKTVLVYPAHEIKSVAQSLLAQAAKSPVYLGVLAADWPSQLGGAHIKQVFANSPASTAGFRLGDIVLSINNHKVASAFDLFQEVSLHSPGDKVKFEILRGEQIKDIIVKITQPPSSNNPIKPPFLNKKQETSFRSTDINKEFLLMRLERLEKEMNMIKTLINGK